MVKAPEPDWPVRGTPGGYQDIWDDPDDAAQVRAQLDAAEQRSIGKALAIAALLKREHDQDATPRPGRPPATDEAPEDLAPKRRMGREPRRSAIAPSPDTQIATAPASAWMHQKLTPATAQLSTVRHGVPAIRAPACYRVAATAAASVVIRKTRHPDTSRLRSTTISLHLSRQLGQPSHDALEHRPDALLLNAALPTQRRPLQRLHSRLNALGRFLQRRHDITHRSHAPSP
jgi:hypothetical protein